MNTDLVTLGPCDKGQKKQDGRWVSLETPVHVCLLKVSCIPRTLPVQEGRLVSLETPFPVCLLKVSCIPWTLPGHPRASFVLHRQLFHDVTVFYIVSNIWGTEMAHLVEALVEQAWWSEFNVQTHTKMEAEKLQRCPPTLTCFSLAHTCPHIHISHAH